LKICIPIPHYDRGGMYTFLANFRKWLHKHDVVCTEEIYDDYDILFTNSWKLSSNLLSQIKKTNPETKIIHRIDGSHRDYGGRLLNDHKQAISNLYADLTIFQSLYSRFATRTKYPVIANDGPIIYNPVDIEIFKPSDKPFNSYDPIKVCVVSFSTNPLKGTGHIGKLASENPHIEFVLCGRFPKLPSLANIKHLGVLKKESLASEIRKCSILLNLSKNESCPNVVLEGMASGLPILYTDSGGTHELVENAGLPTTITTFNKDITKITSSYEQFSRIARERVMRNFTPDIIFEQYIREFKSASCRNKPSLYSILKYQLKGYPIIINPLHILPYKLKMLMKKIKLMLGSK
tara:strand:+ start:4532 stop:5578 length:1047 start_codon:yes stop_codon:yes gene_type:complete